MLQTYNNLLVEKNKSLNLTSHKTEEQSWDNNINDSLLFLDCFPEKGKMLDIGSGGGCPAIPLKISHPALNVTMLDSVRKKVDFLNETVACLKLENIQAIHSRVEDYAQKNRDSFDIVTARALAPLPTLLEYAIPFLRTGGFLFAYKGKNWYDELKGSTALSALNAEITQIKTANQNDKQRVLLIIKKVAPTDKKYPRGKNLPRLSPL